MFNRNNVKSVATTLASFATNGSSAVGYILSFPSAAEVVGLRFIASTSQPLATTTASGLTVTAYKTASHANSIVGTFNTSGTGVAAGISANGVLSTTISLKKFAAGGVLVVDAVGGVAMGSVLGAVVVVDYIYGYED